MTECRAPRCLAPRLIIAISLLAWLAMGSMPRSESQERFPADLWDGDSGVGNISISDSVSDSGAVLGTGPWPARPVTNWAFGVGETLHYSIGWEKIVAGHGEVTVGPVVDTLGRLCYPIVSTVKTTTFFSTFYKVDDRIATLLDAREIYPLVYDKKVSEGRYKRRRRVEFDPIGGLARTAKDTLAVPPYVQDDLSLLYYVRTMKLSPGTDIEMDVYGGKKLYRLTVRILKKERIKVKAGVFSTIVVEPLLQAAGLFQQEGRVRVWLTDDRVHLPVLMKSKMVVGSIVAELEDYRLGRIRRY
jgi:hypothetical protein